MKSFKSFLTEFTCPLSDGEPISKEQLNVLEKSLDKLFSKYNIDVVFTKHFFDRLNDARNKTQITVCELGNIFKDAFNKYGAKMGKTGGGSEIEELIKSISTDINIPIVLKWDRNKKEVDLITKTIMRKKNFKTSGKVITVESR